MKEEAMVSMVSSERLTKQDAGSMIFLLQQIQEKHNYLPEDVLRKVAVERDVPLIDIYSLATFYKSFSLTPRGKHKVTVCTGTACHVHGAQKVEEEISRILGVEPGSTTRDGEYSLESVNCLGACALAPLVTIDGDYHGNMTPAKLYGLFGERVSDKKSARCHCQNEVIAAI